MMKRKNRSVTAPPLGAEEYLKRPYMRTVFQEEDGSFRAEIQEFPGCIAVGDTQQEALSSLEDVADSWIASMLASGQGIPEPFENNEFSGKLLVRLPKSLHRRASLAAERDGVSLNQYIVTCLADNIGGRKAVSNITNVNAQTFFLAPSAPSRQAATISDLRPLVGQHAGFPWSFQQIHTVGR
jgi:antitoxin HicB